MKRRRILALLLALTLLAGLAACGASASADAETAQQTESVAQQETDTAEAKTADTETAAADSEAAASESAALEDTVSDTAALEDAASDAAALENAAAPAVLTEEFDEKQSGMLPVLDSILLSQREDGLEYDADSAESVWSVLYYLLSKWDLAVPAAGDGEREDGAQLYTRLGVAECAMAAFAELDELPLEEIGAANGKLSYDESWDAILCVPGDRGDIESELTAWTDNGDGTYTAVIRLYIVSEDQTLAEGTFQLIDNPYADGITDPLFYYSVRSAQIEETAELAEYEAEGVYQGLADEHTAEITVEDEATAFQLTDRVLGQLQILSEGTKIRFRYTADEVTGVRTVTTLISFYRESGLGGHWRQVEP